MPHPSLELFALSCASAALLACSSGDPGSAGGAGGAASTSGSKMSGSTSGSGSGSGGGDAGKGDGGPIGGDRPVTVHVPAIYAPGTPAPLVVMLHGYTASGAIEEFYLNITAESDKRGFLYAHPDGTKDQAGNRFWNATDACCNLNMSTVDDSTYLSAVIADIETRFSVDPKRIYLVGHSNGAFMSYRMACDHADQIAAIGSLAGAMFADVSKCKPSSPVSVLEIHGTADATIAYSGGAIAGNPYPAAKTSVSDWVTTDGCDAAPDLSAPALDLDTSLPGDETTVTKYEAGCKQGTGAELWSIQGGSHIPTISPAFIPKLFDFLYAHPKP